MRSTDYNMEYWTGPITPWSFGYFQGLHSRNHRYAPEWGAADRVSYDLGWKSGMSDRVCDTVVALGMQPWARRIRDGT